MKPEERVMQEKYMEMKLVEEQLEEIQKQAKTVEKQVIELASTVQSIDEFRQVNAGDELLIPLSGGIFVKARLKDNKQFLVNVGADIVVIKDIEATKTLISNQVDEMQNLHAKMHLQMQRLVHHSSGLEKELKELISKEK
jgi:prefoldin alpha subunit